MPVVYEAADGRIRNLTGIGIGVTKGDLDPADVEPGPELGTVSIRGRCYRRVDPDVGDHAP